MRKTRGIFSLVLWLSLTGCGETGHASDYDYLQSIPNLEVLVLPEHIRLSEDARASLLYNITNRQSELPLVVMYNSMVGEFTTESSDKAIFIDIHSTCERYRQAAVERGVISEQELNVLRRANQYPIFAIWEQHPQLIAEASCDGIGY